MFRDTWLGEFRKSVEIVASAIAEKDNLAKDEALLVANRIFQVLVARFAKYSPSVKNNSLPGVLNSTNKVVRRRFGWFYALAVSRKWSFGLLGSAIELMRRGVRWYDGQREAYHAEHISQVWAGHPDLKPMLEVLSTPPNSNGYEPVDGASR
jgi:hypothetical protein